jgi:FAD/FMN-containing dehydrogenase/Fe-S oxidoreductase
MPTHMSEPPKSVAEVPAKPTPGRAMGMAGAVKIDVQRLYQELTATIDGEVRFDRSALGLYATDSSNFRQVPLGVVIPRTLGDVANTHRICHRHAAPVVSRGGGTSLSGETVNFAVVIDHSKYLNRIGEPDAVRRLITVENGAINQKVNERAARVNLVFGPDPSSHGYCTIGGNIGNNSCGIHSVQSQLYGPGPRTSDNLHALEVVTYDGERFWVGVDEEAQLDRIIREGGRKGQIYRQLRELRDRHADEIRQRFRPVTEVPRRVSGYNLDELLPERGFNVARAIVGTEGTCVTVLQATLMLTPALLKRVTVVIAYDDVCEAGDHIPEILEWKPIGLEAVDHLLIEDETRENKYTVGIHELPDPTSNAWLLVQFGSASVTEAERQATGFIEWLVGEKGYGRHRVKMKESREASGDTEKLWQIREGGLGSTAFPPDGRDHWPAWEDSAVPTHKVAAYLRDLKRLYAKHGLRGAIYGHLGQGCIHSRISFDLRTAEGLSTYRRFLDEASDLVISYGGSLSGEHGDGQQRAQFLEKQYGPQLVQAMREFKQIWDPDWKMNPGKVIDPYPIDSHLKLGTQYNPPRPPVKFSYKQDGGDFAQATLRCVGAGKCRQPEGVDVMCPSYIVTRDEKHSTRGRARLLFEMLRGEVIKDGWKSQEVYDALDLCLACKGCTNECPVNVDMPTYKAEFLYHHYKGLRRNRKRHMYAFGFIDQFARLGSLIPEVANFVTHAPGLGRLAKRAAGMDLRREIPRFAPMNLQTWFKNRGGTRERTGKKVILWPDTFNNYFHAQVGVACVESLEAAGFEVLMPLEHVCCGRPLYDYGFLDVAERYLRRTVDQLRDEIRQGTPVVGMEPSCMAVFKDELPKILPHDDDGKRLVKNAYHWPEFFQKQGIELPRLEGREALLWGHCHHKATGGIGPEKALLQDSMGMKVEQASGGCCGLAGSWGFEAGKYDLSMKAGEVGWLPAVRRAASDTIVVADGFSCKTQLEQSRVGRLALHTAEVMKMARELGPAQVRGPYPEQLRPRAPAPPLWIRVGRTAAVLAAVAAAAWPVLALLPRRDR